MKKIKYDTPLTWDDIADFYHEKTGRQARIRPMDTIANWAKKQKEIYINKNGCFCRRRMK